MSLSSPEHFPAAGKCVYLNSASVALMYKGAETALIEWQKDVSEWGTLHFDEEAEDRVFDDLRLAFAGLIGTAPENVAVGSSATEMLASLAWAIAPAAGKNVVCVDLVFPSTAYPWSRVARQTGCEMRWVKARDVLVDTADILAAIDENTAVVCLSHVEYGGGQIYDLDRIGEAAHRNGALLVIDATQSVGAIPVDMSRQPVDALISGSYKWMCGPFGVGVMYVEPSLAARLDPGIVGWRSNNAIYSLDAARVEYADTARRFEFSTMAYGCALGLAESIRHLQSIGIDHIRAHNLGLARSLTEGLQDFGASVISPTEGAEQSSIVSFRLAKHASADVVRHLAKDDIIVSPRRDFVRASFHLYNDESDVAALLKSLSGI